MANNVSAFVQSLIEKVKMRGYTEEEFLRVAANREDKLVEKFADVISEESAQSGESYHTIVNYDLPVSDAIDAGDYQAVNASITSENFPSERHGEARIEINLVRFDQRMTSEDILREFVKQGLRAAELPELLAFAATYPGVQRKFTVIGLGSAWRDSKGYLNVPCLYTASEGRYLDLHWWDDGWYSFSRFATVKK